MLDRKSGTHLGHGKKSNTNTGIGILYLNELCFGALVEAVRALIAIVLP